jgi:prepilin-type N-terminal cleavage/methylation domain-containing protein
MHRHSLRPRKAGFSLLEIIVAIAILATLVGVVAMNAGGAVERGKSSKVLQLVDTFRTACASYHVDVGSYPYEYSGYAAAYRKLSGTQTSAGWRGPYIEAPLTTNQNPYGGAIHLYNTVTANGWITGFDCDGDGTEEVTSSACMLWLAGVSSAAAQAIDDALDAGISGTWSSSGRVRYTSSNSQLYILVYR